MPKKEGATYENQSNPTVLLHHLLVQFVLKKTGPARSVWLRKINDRQYGKRRQMGYDICRRFSFGMLAKTSGVLYNTVVMILMYD